MYLFFDYRASTLRMAALELVSKLLYTWYPLNEVMH